MLYPTLPHENGTSRVVLEVEENPLTFAKIGLNYNQFSGISAIINLTSRNFLTPTSRSLVTLNIGQNFRIRGEHLQYFSRRANFAFTLGTQFDQFKITTYNTQFKEAGLYNQNYFRLDGRFSYFTNRNFTLGLGDRFEWTDYDPSITSSLEFKGRNDFTTGYVFVRANTLDKPFYPRKGMKIEVEGDYVFEQSPQAQYFASNTTRSDTSFSNKPYQRILFKLERYTPLGNHYTLLTHAQVGMNFTYNVALGPLEVSGMYSDQSKRVIGYVNIGIPF